MKSHFRPLDFLVLAIVLVSAIVLMLNTSVSKGEVVVIDADGKRYEYSLKKNNVYSVEGPLGFTEVEVNDGKVRIIDSPCPGKTCVEQGWTSPIVCLPNKIVVTVLDYGEFDAVAE